MKRQWLFFGLALLILAAIGFYIVNQTSNAGMGSGPPPTQTAAPGKPAAPAQGPTTPASKPESDDSQTAEVRIISVSAASYQTQVDGYGEIQANFDLTLKSTRTGQIVAMNPNLKQGQRIKAGSQLVALENSEYQAAVSSAEAELRTAEVTLLEEQREAEQARSDWQNSGFTEQPDSPLVLREPQLNAAKAAVANAKQQLASAKRALQETQVTAPFDALVVERLVSPGDYLGTGSEIAQFYSTDKVEVEIPLTAQEWQQLPPLPTLVEQQWSATLTQVETQDQWTAKVSGAAANLDSSTRQRALLLSVSQPFDQTPALLPGTFVKATLAGSEQSGLWKLPSSALSQQGDLWYVDGEQLLQKLTAKVVFRQGSQIYIEAPDSLAQQQLRILVQPLSSYQVGMRVNPVEVAADE